MRLAWGKRVEEDFIDKIFEICDDFKWNPETHASWLMSCIAFETGETFNPSIRNYAGSGAVGLIQFMPTAARGLGTSTLQLISMDVVEQLEYVQRYFTPYSRRINSLADMYMAILMPKFVGKPDDSVLFVAPNVSYRQNSGLDNNADGKVTKLEATAKVQAKLEKGLQERYSLEIKPK